MFDIPWPEAISPDFAASRRRCMEWAFERGLVDSDTEAAELERLCAPELAARATPRATGEELDVTVKLMLWFFPFDDAFDRLSVPEAERTEKAYAGLLDDSREPATMMERVFHEWLALAMRGMSPAWRKRFLGHWREDLKARVDEASNRAAGNPSFDEYMLVRRTSISLQQCLDLIERAGGFELPERVAAHPLMAQLRQDSCEVVAYVNDVFSADKESADGDVNNLLLVLQASGWSQHEAIERAEKLASERIADFREAESQLLDELQGDERERTELFTRGMRHWMRGNLDWSRSTRRYRVGYQTQQYSL
jgi:Terpene synthase family 2, C-terminal metal binding